MSAELVAVATSAIWLYLLLGRGFFWRAAEREAFVTAHRGGIDLAFSLEQDTWNGERYLQLSVADFRAPEI